ncbi:hypothetical protein ACQ4PT_035876 [Festuca glaucescens]
MAVYYRYRSGVDTFSLPVAAPSISVGEVKRLIMGTSRHGHGRTRGRGPRECIAISDAQTGEEYTNDRALGPAQLDGGGAPSRRASGRCHRVAIHSTPQSDARRWRFFVGFFLEVEVERVGGRGGRRDQGYQRAYPGRTPHAGYVCRRCRVPGHFIQHCPTNGDPRFDFGKATSVISPAPAAPVDDDGVPADLHCKICRKVMVDAVVTSKCCFSSFCERCIRARIVANSKCVCRAQARADDLIPNPALRTTISNILAARASSVSGGTTEK